MFHLVDFKGGRARAVVPDTWMSINDTLCLLPPKVSDQALEVMARNRVEPGEGWQIFGVKSLQTFESYAEAKKQMERPKETPQSQAETQRKRKKPGYLEDYDVLDSGGGHPSYTVFRTEEVEEDDESEDEWEPAPAPQFVPRMNKVSSCKRIIENYGNKRRIMQQFNQPRPVFRKQTVEVKCACKSSCHGTILQALQSMQNQLDKTNQMVQQLLMGRPKQTQSNPKRFPFRQPTNHVSGQHEVEEVLPDDNTNYIQSLFQNQDTSAAQRRTETTTSFTADEDSSFIILDRPSISEADIIKKIDIRKWLMSYPKGVELLLKLDSEIFFPKDRQLLVRIVCKKLIEECGNAYPTSQIKEQVAKEIVKTFPFLRSSRGAGHEAFYDLKTGNGFIGYRLKTIRKSFPFEERRNASSAQMQKLADEGPPKEQNVVAVKEELLSPSDLEENVASMAQQDPDEESKAMIVAKLRETMKNRQKEIKETDMSVADIFNRYPRLKDYKGEMITMEFAELFSNGEKFLQTFESYFAPRILSYVTLHKPLLLLHVANCEDNLKSLLLLPELLPAPNYKRSNQTPRGKPNARKIPNPDLIVFVKSEEHFRKVTTDTESQSLQPFLICLTSPQEGGGSKKQYFIRVDETLIEGPDEPMAAFDVLFKMHYVFNVQYAKSLENFYNFVSSIVYEIDTPRSSSDAFYTLLRNIPISVDESSL